MNILTKASQLTFVLLILSITALAQSEHSTRTIVVNGHTGEATIYRIDGKSFVDLESLVQIANGTMGFKGNQITLIFPASNRAQKPTAATANRPSTEMSTDFMKAGVEFISDIKTWTNALTYAVQKGVPGDGSRIVILHDRAAEGLRIARVSVRNESDNNAFQLLATHFADVKKWSDSLIGERKSMDTGKYSMSQDALERDPTYQRITSCTRFLGTMVPSGHYQDDSNCR